MRQLTDKKKVLKRHPKAFCYKSISGLYIVWYDKTTHIGDGVLGLGATPSIAWAKAANLT